MPEAAAVTIPIFPSRRIVVLLEWVGVRFYHPRIGTVGAPGSDGFDALPVGRRVTFSKTISESDVYLFAGITGDLSPNHVDEEYMRKTRYGRRIAHGALALSLMSNTSTKILDGLPGTWVSYGYDRVRFPAPLFIGDTVTVQYERDTPASIPVLNGGVYHEDGMGRVGPLAMAPVPLNPAAAREKTTRAIGVANR